VRAARRLLGPLLALALAGCAGDPQSPEAQIRSVLAELEAAAEAGELGPFKAHVSERYADGQGFDKEALVGFARLHVLRSARRHVFVRVRAIELREPQRAEVTLAVALAGSRLATPGDAARMRADVYKVDLDLEDEDGAWRIVWARWRPTAPADLL
jgi:hypothetical protein